MDASVYIALNRLVTSEHLAIIACFLAAAILSAIALVRSITIKIDYQDASRFPRFGGDNIDPPPYSYRRHK